MRGKVLSLIFRSQSLTTMLFHKGSYLRSSNIAIGEGNGNPLQCSCLENPMDGRAWWAAVYGVTQSRPRLKRLSSSSSKAVHLIFMSHLIQGTHSCISCSGNSIFQHFYYILVTLLNTVTLSSHLILPTTHR